MLLINQMLHLQESWCCLLLWFMAHGYSGEFKESFDNCKIIFPSLLDSKFPNNNDDKKQRRKRSKEVMPATKSLTLSRRQALITKRYNLLLTR